MNTPSPGSPYVFLSYASVDHEQALSIAALLKAASVPVWLDRQAIGGGTAWGTEIVDGIRGCAALLLLCSEASLRSRNVRQEVQVAWRYERPYLPLLLDETPVPESLQYFLEGWQWIEVLDRADEAWLSEVLAALARLGVGSARTDGAALGEEPVAGVRPSGSRGAPSNLPLQLTSFVGREAELAAVVGLLGRARLVSLLGPGGAGKTRLALEAAGEALAQFPGGVAFVELAPLTDPTLIGQAVAAAMGLREQPGQPLLGTLTEYLKSHRVLLVFDNCEHLVEASARLVDSLLRAAPELRILATSREALGVPGEAVYRVPSLSLPDAGLTGEALVEALAYSDAVRLFLERAQLAKPGFTVTPADAPAVAEICRRLDGIPLALELAAARIRVLSPGQIAERLADRFRLLTGGARTAPTRQQTLRAALDWSYEQLEARERAVLRRLSVFAGGWSVEAAEAVCADEVVETWEVLDCLQALVDKSLVVAEEGAAGVPRDRLLETVRAYAAEKLAAAGEGEATAERHRDWYLALAEEAEPQLTGRDLVPWSARLEAEHDNLRAALDWCNERGDGPGYLRLAGALGRFWQRRGYLDEGRRHLDAALALGDDAPAPARERALFFAGFLAFEQGDAETAERRLAEAQALSEALGDEAGIARALGALGNVALRRGEVVLATARYEESLARHRAAGDTRGVASVVGELGKAAHLAGDTLTARLRLEESLALRRELGNAGDIAAGLTNLGLITAVRGEYTDARAALEEGLGLHRQLGDRVGIAATLRVLGNLAMATGDYAAAAELTGESLALCRELGDANGVSACLGNLAIVALEDADHAGARRLFEESLERARAIGVRTRIVVQLGNLALLALVDGDLDDARRRLDEGVALGGDAGETSAVLRDYLGRLTCREGDQAAARRLHRQSLAVARESGDARDVVSNLDGLAATFVQDEGAAVVRAARLLGAADALGEASGVVRPPLNRALYERSLAAVQTALGEAAFAEAWTAGRLLSSEQAVAEALEEAPPA